FDSLDSECDRQMRLADTRRPEQDHILGTVNEAESRQFPHDLAVEGGLTVEVELLQRLQPWEPSHSQPHVDAPLLPPAPFRFEGPSQKSLVIQIAFCGLLTDAVELGEQVFHLQPFEKDAEFHHDATSS